MTKSASYVLTLAIAGWLFLVLYRAFRFILGFGAMATAELTFACVGAVMLIGLGAWALIVKDRQTEKPLLSTLLAGVLCFGLGIFSGFQAFDIWERNQDRFAPLVELIN